MDTPIETQTLTAPATDPVPAAPLAQCLKPPTSHGRTGKVARLPKELRYQINVMLQDGVPYLQIIDHLALHAYDINEDNLSNWKAGGYLDWLEEQRLIQAIKSKYQLAESIVRHSPSDNAAGQAVLHIIATNLCKFLAETDPETLRESLLSDSDKFTRFVNSMVRLAEGGIKCGIHHFRSEDRAAEAAKARNPADKPGISDEALHTAEEKLNLL